MAEAVEEAQLLGVGPKQLVEMLRLLYSEEE